MNIEVGRIDVMRLLRVDAQRNADGSGKRDQMGGISQKNEPPKKSDEKSQKPPRIPVEDDDYEDGDIATPKRDRDGNDDEPL